MIYLHLQELGEKLMALSVDLPLYRINDGQGLFRPVG